MSFPFLQIVLVYPDRPLYVTLSASSLAAAPGHRFAAHGTEGSFESDGLDPQEGQLRDAEGPRPGDARFGVRDGEGAACTAKLVTAAGGAERVALERGDYGRLFSSLACAIDSNDASLFCVDSATAALVIRIIEAARESSRSGAAVDV